MTLKARGSGNYESPCIVIIAGSAVALQAHEKINRKMGNSIPCKIVTPENFILKLCIHDHVGEVTHYAIFWFQSVQWGLLPK